MSPTRNPFKGRDRRLTILLHIGSFWEADTQPGQQPQSLGSIGILNAESMEVALQTLKEDMYYKNDVWDWDKVGN